MAVLVTGGCGYIGSHVSKLLVESGRKVVILDNLATGYRELKVEKAILVEGDCRNAELVRETIKKHGIDTIMHFAASIIVPESVEKPFEYHHNNFFSTYTITEAAKDLKIRSLIFSSTAAVYGNSKVESVSEDAPLFPENPYGRSKVAGEWLIQDAAKISKFKYAILRYFNVAGASSDLSLGPMKDNATHLLRVASEVAVGKRSTLDVYGTDYTTPDGTAVRDYVHVEDIAQAHLDCLTYLEKGGQSDIFNCGYGKGYSVKEVIAAFSKVLGRPLPTQFKPRRPGDVEKIVANSKKIKEIVCWKPKFDTLSLIVKSSVDWENKLRTGLS